MSLPKPGTKRYYRRLEQSGILYDIAVTLRMPSQHYYGYALEGSSGRVAVVVVETTKPEGLDEDRVRTILTGKDGTELAKFLEICRTFGPDLDYARDQGF